MVPWGLRLLCSSGLRKAHRSLQDSESFPVNSSVQPIVAAAHQLPGASPCVGLQCRSTMQDGSAKGVTARKVQVQRFYEVLWNAHDLDAIPSILHDDFTFRGSLGDERRGHKGSPST